MRIKGKYQEYPETQIRWRKRRRKKQLRHKQLILTVWYSSHHMSSHLMRWKEQTTLLLTWVAFGWSGNELAEREESTPGEWIIIIMRWWKCWSEASWRTWRRKTRKESKETITDGLWEKSGREARWKMINQHMRQERERDVESEREWITSRERMFESDSVVWWETGRDTCFINQLVKETVISVSWWLLMWSSIHDACKCTCVCIWLLIKVSLI